MAVSEPELYPNPPVRASKPARDSFTVHLVDRPFRTGFLLTLGAIAAATVPAGVILILSYVIAKGHA